MRTNFYQVPGKTFEEGREAAIASYQALCAEHMEQNLTHEAIAGAVFWVSEAIVLLVGILCLFRLWSSDSVGFVVAWFLVYGFVIFQATRLVRIQEGSLLMLRNEREELKRKRFCCEHLGEAWEPMLTRKDAGR